MLMAMFLQMVSTRLHDGSAVETFHCDTAMLLLQIMLRLNCFARKCFKGLPAAFNSAEPVTQKLTLDSRSCP